MQPPAMLSSVPIVHSSDERNVSPNMTQTSCSSLAGSAIMAEKQPTSHSATGCGTDSKSNLSVYQPMHPNTLSLNDIQ
jgi:hypothetical protein